MNKISIGILLAVIAFAIIIYLNYKARQNRIIEVIDVPTFDPSVKVKWNKDSTIIALFLSKFGDTALGSLNRVAGQILRRTITSLQVKIKIFEDLYNDNITKNATKLDMEVFDDFCNEGFNEIYEAATEAISRLQ